MRVRTMLSILAALLIATAAAAQQPTGEIFGKATDQSGAVLPGVTVFNVNTVQALQRTQNGATANNISSALAPRVARVGLRVNW